MSQVRERRKHHYESSALRLVFYVSVVRPRVYKADAADGAARGQMRVRARGARSAAAKRHVARQVEVRQS